MNIILKNLGFDSHFESICKDMSLEHGTIARVTAQHKGIYYIKGTFGDLQARVTGKQMFDAVSREDYPAVGDWVEIEIIDNEQATIKQILPRKTIIRKSDVSRKSNDRTKNQVIAANVDVAFAVESVDRDYNLNRFERYFALAQDGNVEPAIILNKVDLISEQELNEKIVEIKERFKNCLVIATSTTTEQGLEELTGTLKIGRTYCFLGSSGVGKSSLINALVGLKIAKTGAIGGGTDRGRHVTTHREMFVLDGGGIVIDNPGMREVGLANSALGVKTTFAEVEDFASQCKFSDCSHTQESGCAVLVAVDTGLLDRDKYHNYLRLRKESEHYSMSDFEKRNKDKKFGKFVKESIKRMKEFE